MPTPPAPSVPNGAPPPRLALLGFRPGPGGVARVMIDLMTGCARAGVAVDLLLPPGDYPDLDALVEPNLAPPARFELSDHDPRLAERQLRAYLDARAPRAILSNKDRASALLARVTARGARPPVWPRVGSDVREKVLSKPWPWRRAYRNALRQTYLAADGLIANSGGVAAGLRELLGADAPPIRCIPNPIDLARVERLAAAPPAHPWFQTRAPGTALIVASGRLVAVKDFATLLRAFALLRQRRAARLAIIGEGRQRAALLRLARRLGLAGAVDLPGHVANPFAYLRHADLFVLSSRFEGAPNVLIEALACGTRCVATDCRSGPAEILEQGALGRLVPVGQPAALAAAMVASLAEPPAPERARAAARRYDSATSVARYLDALGLATPDAGSPDEALPRHAVRATPPPEPSPVVS